MYRRAVVVAVVGLAAISAAAPAIAADDQRGPAYRLSVDVDVPLVLIAGSLSASYFLMGETPTPPCAPLCDRARVNVVDRWAAGYYSHRWSVIGDVATGLTITIVPLALFAGERIGPGLRDLLVVAESALVSSAIQVPVSYAVGRPRPRVYGESASVADRSDANAGRSFFSGHVANCVAATIATQHALLRVGRPRLGWAAFAVGMAGSALIGVARVAAGSHFPTDVLAGVAVGVGAGIAVPAAHGAPFGVAPMAGVADGLMIAGAF